MRRYYGKNAWWFILIFIVFNLLPLPIFFKDNIEFGIVSIITLLFYYSIFELVFVPLFVRNYIDLYDDYFWFYFGFSKRRVLIQDIKKIEKSRDMTASSATSLDRIYIVTKDDEFMISLKQNDFFLEEIRRRIRNL